MKINEGTSKMTFVPDGTKLVTKKCECGCHVVGGMHFIPCCVDGYYQEPETKAESQEQNRPNDSGK